MLARLLTRLPVRPMEHQSKPDFYCYESIESLQTPRQLSHQRRGGVCQRIIYSTLALAVAMATENSSGLLASLIKVIAVGFAGLIRTGIQGGSGLAIADRVGRRWR